MEDLLSTDTYDKIYFLMFRGLFIYNNSSDIVKLYDNYEKYQQMLDTIDFSIYHDSNFFLIKDYMQKTLSFIKDCSIKFNTKGNVRKKENDIIGELNKVKYLGDKDLRIRNFYELERNLRMNLPYDDKDIINSVACDYSIIHQVLSSVVKKEEIKNLSIRQFVESTAFFLDSIPEFYEDCPAAIETSINFLEEAPKTKYHKLNKSIKVIKKRLKNF